MGRHAEGWKLHSDPRTGLYKVRFTHGGKRWKLGTGTRDSGEAAGEAARLYGAVVSGNWRPESRLAPPVKGRGIIDVASAWLAEIESSIDPQTFKLYSDLYVSTHFEGFFKTVDQLTTVGVEGYIATRLKAVTRETLKKELSVLRQFARWAHRRGYLAAVPEIETPGAQVLGTPNAFAKRVFQIFSPDEVSRIIEKLPERVSGPRVPAGFWVKARIAFLWETGLRPATVSKLTAPGDYASGRKNLTIRDEADKNRWGRDLPLSTAARTALDSVTPKEGVIFGEHDTRGPLRKAALEAGIDAQRAKRISEYDLRHSRLTFWGSTTTNLSALMYLAGHKQPATSARYLKPQIEAAEAVILGAEAPMGKAPKGRRKRAGNTGKGKTHGRHDRA